MAQLGQTSLPLADGSGSLGTLGVYHELHCIVRVFPRPFAHPSLQTTLRFTSLPLLPRDFQNRAETS